MAFFSKNLGLIFFSFLFFGISADNYRLFANYDYSEEHAAWGGNGGWWGGGNSDWYGDNAWRNENYDPRPCSSHHSYHYHHSDKQKLRLCSNCRSYHPQGRYSYHYNVTPPENQKEYNDTVPGAGLYLDLGR